MSFTPTTRTSAQEPGGSNAWTCCRYNANNAWYANGNNGYFNNNNMYNSNLAVPVANYSQNRPEQK